MFKSLIKGLLLGIATKRMEECRRLSIQLLKIEAAKYYLHGVQMTRWSVIGLVQMSLVIGLICFGALLFHAGLYILIPWTVRVKALLSICLGLSYVFIGCVALRVTLDEKNWIKKSGVAEMLEEATRESKKD